MGRWAGLLVLCCLSHNFHLSDFDPLAKKIINSRNANVFFKKSHEMQIALQLYSLKLEHDKEKRNHKIYL